MANGFPEGNFRIVNKATRVCLASKYGGKSYGVIEGVNQLGQKEDDFGEKLLIEYSHTRDRLLTLHEKVMNVDEEIWYFDSHADNWGKPVNLLYNKVRDIRSAWVLDAIIYSNTIGARLQNNVLEYIIQHIPELNKDTIIHLSSGDGKDIIDNLYMIINLMECDSFNKDDAEKKFFYEDIINNVNVLHAYFYRAKIEMAMSAIIFYGGELTDLVQHLLFLNVEHFTLATPDLFKLNDSGENDKFESISDSQERRDKAIEIINCIIEILRPLDSDFYTSPTIINTIKDILQSTLKSEEPLKQLKMAQSYLTNNGDVPVYSYSGFVLLQGHGRQNLSKWIFEDGFIFTEDNPNAVLAQGMSSDLLIIPRSSDANQLWELVNT